MPFFTKKRTVTLEIYNLALFVTAPSTGGLDSYGYTPKQFK